MRRLVALMAFVAAAPLVAQPAGQSDEQTCLKEGGDAEWRITACTNWLKLKSLTPSQRAQALYFRAESLSLSGDHRDALTDLDAALRLKLDPGYRESILVMKARVLDRSKAPARAMAVANEAVAVRGGLEAHYWRAVLRSDAGEFRASVEDVDSALRLKMDPPAREELLNLKVRLMIRLKDPVRAMATAEQAVAVRGGAEAYYWRGQLKNDKADHRGALADYDRSNAAGSRNPNSWNGACWARAAHLNFEIDRARKDCARAIELAPNNADALDSAGMVELRQGRYSVAWSFYDRAVKADGGDASARYGRGLSALNLGRTGEGNADIAAAIRLEPETATNYAKRGLKP